MKKIRIGTRASRLALWQANHIADALRQAHPGVETELVTMTTKGDRVLDVPLYKVGGKALFVKEIEEGLAAGSFDLAVHSMKDVPGLIADAFEIACVPEREDPRDALISREGQGFDALPQGAVVGTSSPRRAAQLLHRRPDLQTKVLRGNVETRIRKMREGEYDAILLANAGLLRLELAEQITEVIEPEVLLPAVGQGALAIEIRAGDTATAELVQVLHDRDTGDRVAAERGFLATLEGGCQVPIAGYAVLEGDDVVLEALIADPEGSPVIRGTERGPRSEARDIGVRLANRLLSQGGREILDKCLAIERQ